MTSVMVSLISMAEARAWQLNESMGQLRRGSEPQKLLRLRSLQVDPPIHSTKSEGKALAKTDSLKTQKSLQVPKKKAELARMISICNIRLNSSILSFSFHGPAAVALLQCFSLHALVADLVAGQGDFFYGLVDAKRVSEGLQRWPSGEPSRGELLKYFTAAVLNYLHCQLVRMPAFLDCQTPRSPVKLGLALPTPAEPSAAHHRYFESSG